MKSHFSLLLLAVVSLSSCGSGLSDSYLSVNADSTATSQAKKLASAPVDDAARAFVDCAADSRVDRDYIVKLNDEIQPLLAAKGQNTVFAKAVDSIADALPADKRAVILVKLIESPQSVAAIVAADPDRQNLEMAVEKIYSSDNTKLEQYRNSLQKSK